MQARKPRIEQLAAGSILVERGKPGTDLYLGLDEVMRVERDGVWLAAGHRRERAGRS